jgi:uncharacterized protein involved in outer membrane biogenesis
MKKIIIITGIIIIILVALLAVTPLFFRQTLLDKTKTTINKNINAKVEFNDLKLSLLRNFPKLTIELTNIIITGKKEFHNDTLLSVTSLRTKTSLNQLFNKEGIGIEEIIIIKPHLNLISGKTGNVNWDIAPAGETAADSEENELELNLDKIEISDAKFVYEDRGTDMLLNIENINIDISGKMYGSTATLRAEGKSDRFSLVYGGVNYISNVSLETSSLLAMDYDKMDIGIKENELLVNRLPMEVTGNIQVPGDSMFFDLQLKTKESGFDNFLALVPPDYEEYLKDIQTSGTAVVNGIIKGWYFDEDYPSVDIALDVKEGNFHYADLPEEIRNISADVSVIKPQGVLDLTEISVRKAHAEVKNSPVDLTLLMKNIVSDPYFDGSLTGNVDFNDLKDALPLDSVNISGIINANLIVEGNYSAIENEEYNKIKSDGNITLSNFIYEATDLTQNIVIPNGNLEFTPSAVKLAGFNMKVGQSDLRLSGNVNNYLEYILKDGILSGTLELNSPLVNLNELLRLQVDKKSPAAQSQPEVNKDNEEEIKEVLVFDIPADINFTFHSEIDKVVFERLPITNVNGLITAQNGKLVLNGLRMNMLNGEMVLTGSYENTPANKPLFDFGIEMKNFDIPHAYQTLTGIQRMLPIAGYSRGNFSSNLQIDGQLNSGFNLMASSINGNGAIMTENLSIIESPLFNQLNGIIREEKLKNVQVDDFRASVDIKNGEIDSKPFVTRIAGQETTIKGNINTQNIVDLQMNFNVERGAFGSDIQNILSALPGEERIDYIPATVVIKGPVKNPEVKVNLEDARKKITEEIKKSTQDDLKKSLNKVGEGLKNLLK